MIPHIVRRASFFLGKTFLPLPLFAFDRRTAAPFDVDAMRTQLKRGVVAWRGAVRPRFTEDLWKGVGGR